MTGVLLSAGLGHEPAPPDGLTAAEGASGISLEWVETDPLAIGYVVYRSVVSTVADPPDRLNDEPIQGGAFVDTDVSSGSFICYTVQTVGPSGLPSLDSIEACASFHARADGFFKRGDADGSGTVNIADPIATLNLLFTGSFDPPCLDAADFNDSGAVSNDDAIAGLSFLFLGAAPPPSPGPNFCGSDETNDGDVELGCRFHICEELGT